MFKKALVALALIMLPVTGAYAQSTATPSVMGYWATTGCQGGSLPPCFIQYGATVPTSAAAGTSDVNITEVGGNAVTTTLPVAGAVTNDNSASTTLQAACSALCANLAVKASAGTLYDFNVSATSTLYASTWYVMVYNLTAAPADGAVTPAKCYTVPANQTTFNGAFTQAAQFSTGVVIGVSTTGCFTKTASTQAFISAGYK